MTAIETTKALAQESLASTRLLARMALRRPMSRASTWFTTVVVPQAAGVAGGVGAVIGAIATPHKLYYLVATVACTTVVLVFAIASIYVVRSGLHEEPVDE